MDVKYCKSPVSRKLRRGLGRMELQQMLIVDNLARRRKRTEESVGFNENSGQKAVFHCVETTPSFPLSRSAETGNTLFFSQHSAGLLDNVAFSKLYCRFLHWKEMLHYRRGDLCPQPPDDLIVHCSIIQICSAVLHHIVCDSFLNTPFSKQLRPQRASHPLKIHSKAFYP